MTTEVAPPAVVNGIACTECRQVHPASLLLQLRGHTVCYRCKPAFVQKLRENLIQPLSSVRYAGFWIRTGAKILDGIFMTVVQMCFGFICTIFLFSSMMRSDLPNPAAYLMYQLILIGTGYVFQAAYNTFFTGRFGGSPGKLILGLRVITADGGRVGYLRALGRHFAEMVSGIILYVGYLMVISDEERRALHDRICGTRVIYKERPS